MKFKCETEIQNVYQRDYKVGLVAGKTEMEDVARYEWLVNYIACNAIFYV